MEFENPSEIGFTVYTKSGCQNCVKVKNLLRSKNLKYIMIDCDEYIFEDKEKFLLFIRDTAERECRQFPIIFYDGKFIGGYNETNCLVDKLVTSFDANLNF